MGALFRDLTGQRFGRLVVVRREPPSPTSPKARWLCQCDCGGSTVTTTGNLVSKPTPARSCGCLNDEKAAALGRSNRRHGHSPRSGQSPEFRAWHGAKRRVTDQTRKDWPNYGGRGISMADEWLDDFAAFLTHIGQRPGPEYSLDRIDNDGNYAPGNVRWATKSEQNRNKRRNAA